MCVIAAKRAGVDFPSDQYIENMWFKNPDGAGFMYAKDGQVYIEKGFMKYLDFTDRIEKLSEEIDLKETAMVLHFRITTSGGTCKENCHPFPISESVGMLKKLTVRTDLGVAHNGIIDINHAKDVSDTQAYIMKQLAPLKKGVPNFLKNEHLLQLIHNAIESRMAFLDGKGGITLVGDFTEDNGVMYSNLSFKHYDKFLRDFSYGYTFPGDADYWEAHEGLYGDYGYYSHRKVMWLDEDQGQYAFDKAWLRIADAAVDVVGDVYVYDRELDALVYFPEATAWDENGHEVQYDPESDMCIDEMIYEIY